MSALPVGELEPTDKQLRQGTIRTDKRHSHSRRDDGSYNDEDGGELHVGQERSFLKTDITFA
jgi:hypothetical protein